jgi:hypothetical protein
LKTHWADAVFFFPGVVKRVRCQAVIADGAGTPLVLGVVQLLTRVALASGAADVVGLMHLTSVDSYLVGVDSRSVGVDRKFVDVTGTSVRL